MARNKLIAQLESENKYLKKQLQALEKQDHLKDEIVI